MSFPVENGILKKYLFLILHFLFDKVLFLSIIKLYFIFLGMVIVCIFVDIWKSKLNSLQKIIP